MKYSPEYLEWLIKHYLDRLNNAKTVEEKRFLREQLFNFKKTA